MLGLVLQQLGAHHRRQRERDESRDQHRAGQRQREFQEQPARAAGREGDRRIDRRQRQRHGDDGEADFARCPSSAAINGCMPSSMCR